MKIKKIYDFLNLVKKTKQINEGFYAYHCTRAQIEEFSDSHDNAASGAGAFWGPGTYFEILDKDGNFDDYGDESLMSGYRKGKGQQYKVYVDLKPEQLLDTTKSFNDYGMKFTTEEAIEFILKSPLRDHDNSGCEKSLRDFFTLKENYDNFNNIIDKRASLALLIKIIDDFNGSMTDKIDSRNLKSPIKFERILNTVEKSKFINNIQQYSNEAANILGEDDFNDEIENKIKEQVASGERYEAGANNLLKVLKYLGDSKKVEQMFAKYLQLFFKVIKISVNKLPMYFFLRWRTSEDDIKWFMKNLHVYGKIVPEKGLNDANPRKYLIMWKTSGIVKKVGERYKKSEKFTDEIEDEAQDEEIDNMLQYAGG